MSDFKFFMGDFVKSGLDYNGEIVGRFLGYDFTPNYEVTWPDNTTVVYKENELEGN